MQGDFSRDTSEPARLERYTRVLLQQGRTLLDADFNEQSAIHNDLLRTFIADIVGRAWRPTIGSGGFEIKAGVNDFTISKGHFYIDGILCENRREDCTYANQEFLPTPPILPATNFIAYLECWERHLCAVQHPALREIALGGPDTASRAQIVWQVRAASAVWIDTQTSQLKPALDARIAVADERDIALKALAATLDQLTTAIKKVIDAASTQIDLPQPWFDALDWVPPRLRAMAKRDTTSNEACSISSDSRYRGRENQLYRVEVHEGGTLDGVGTKPTFKWSRENGSVLFAVQEGESIAVSGPDQGNFLTLTIPLETLGHDRRTSLCEGDWVEVTSDGFELDAIAPPLGQVTVIDRTRRRVKMRVKVGSSTYPKFADCKLLRRWDQTEHLDPGGTGTVLLIEAIKPSDDPWLPLESGVQIQFQRGGLYRTGDHWLIPTRVASGDVLWPRNGTDPEFIAPNGVNRHRAAIGKVAA